MRALLAYGGHDVARAAVAGGHGRSSLVSLEHTPPQVGHGFLNLHFWGLRWPGGPSKRGVGFAPHLLEGFPGPPGQRRAPKTKIDKNRTRPGLGYVPSCLLLDEECFFAKT